MFVIIINEQQASAVLP